MNIRIAVCGELARFEAQRPSNNRILFGLIFTFAPETFAFGFLLFQFRPKLPHLHQSVMRFSVPSRLIDRLYLRFENITAYLPLFAVSTTHEIPFKTSFFVHDVGHSFLNMKSVRGGVCSVDAHFEFFLLGHHSRAGMIRQV